MPQRLEFVVGAMERREPEVSFKALDDWKQRVRLVRRRTMALEQRMRNAAQVVLQGRHVPRLSDPRLSDQQDHGAALGPAGSALPVLEQRRLLAFAPDQGCETGRSDGVDAPGGACFAEDPEQVHGLSKSFQWSRAEGRHSEETSDE